MNNTDSSITSSIASSEVTAEIFSFLSAVDTGRCGQTCRTWNRVARHSRALWQRYVQEDFGFFGLEEGEGEDTTITDTTDWYAVYAYVKRQELSYWENKHDHNDNSYDFIRTQLVFCDDGSHQPGNNPEHALSRNRDVCWCTNAFVDTNVDLVAEFNNNDGNNSIPHLILAFEIANGNERFSAPVKEALAFASYHRPDLDQARELYDDGIELARNISDNNRKLPNHHPLAGFCFPNIPQAYNAKLRQPARRPTIARYVHFKLLTSSKCGNRVSNNIDVCSLFAFGVALPELEGMIKGNSGSNDGSTKVPPDPSKKNNMKQYTRRHKVREYPWHIHDDFHQQQLNEMRRHHHDVYHWAEEDFDLEQLLRRFPPNDDDDDDSFAENNFGLGDGEYHGGWMLD